MYILYLDESGTHAESRYFALAGLAVFERETFFLSQRLDEIAREYFPDSPETVEFHANQLALQKGRKMSAPFDTLDFGQRLRLRNEIYKVISNSKAHVFGIGIEKSFIDEPPYEHALEQILNRFDRMLNRMYQQGDQQRGLVVVAESSYRQNLESLARRIWTEGHRWGEMRNMSDVPLFAPAKSTRLLQLADFVVNAVYRRFEEGDARHFDAIAQRIDEDRGQMHGLVHLARERWKCFCPSCMLWRFQQMQPDQGLST